MRIATIIIILIDVFHCVSYTQTFPVNTIIENGPIDKRINMVFLGDGYQITEMEKYHQDVQTTVNSIFIESPYKEYKELFNVFAIDIPSNESGTDHPGTANDCGVLQDSVFYRDTYFNTTFDAGNIHRLLIDQAYDKINQVLINNFPQFDMVMMVVNHNWYGGSGGWIAVFSTNYFSAQIAIHEAGHSFAGLLDEYDYGYPNPVQVEGINVTCKTERDSIIWNKWILPTTPIPTPAIPNYSSVIGLFEGAFYSSEDIYRPKLNCKMRSLDVPFCEVCVEQHIKSIFSYLDIIDEHYPNADSITLHTNSTYSFKINILQLLLYENIINWFCDNNNIAQNIDSISLDGSVLSIGSHILEVKVKHITPLVLNDPENLLEDSVEWIVNVQNPNVVEEKDIIPIDYVLEQNFPNPFNPTTKINYSIPQISFVTLKVYDILGKELATLVDEEKPVGNYKINFDANNLSSGIYFYRIQAGSFSDTKKFILLR